jgi:hypothetical protein
MDFILLDEDTNHKDNKNIGAGEPVYVPVSGTVRRVVNDSEEHSRIEFQITENLSYYMSHFQPGSIILREGDYVEAGAFVGVLGELITMVPHLHIEFTNKYHVSHPFIFTEVTTAAGSVKNNILPVQGETFFSVSSYREASQ